MHHVEYKSLPALAIWFEISAPSPSSRARLEFKELLEELLEESSIDWFWTCPVSST